MEHSTAAGTYTHLGTVVTRVQQYVKKLKAKPMPKDYARQVQAIRELAVAEAGFNSITDQLLTPYDFIGGYGPRAYSNRCPKRMATWLYGMQTTWHAARTTFRASPVPAANDYTIVISGQDDEADRPCGIRIRVNDTTIYKGQSKFVRFGWSRCTFRIPGSIIRHQNQLVIENTDSGYHGAAPWVMINYVVIRKAK